MVKLDIKKLEAINFPAVEFLVSEDKMTWEKAVNWVKSQGEDWRLPYIGELQAHAWQLRKFVHEKYCWSGTLVSNSDDYKAWAIDVFHGSTYSTLKNDHCQVVCFRRQ